MLRVKRFAAAIDMIAAGTSAPIPMAAKATPANQSGNMFSNSCGMASWPFFTLIPSAIAMKPSSASRPSISEYSGRIVVLRRITSRLREDSVAVIECGYMNSASAEPSASVAYVHCPPAAGITPPAPAFANFSPAEAKMSSKPPSLIGM